MMQEENVYISVLQAKEPTATLPGCKVVVIRDKARDESRSSSRLYYSGKLVEMAPESRERGWLSSAENW